MAASGRGKNTCLEGKIIGEGSFGKVHYQADSDSVVKVYGEGKEGKTGAVSGIESIPEIDILFSIRSNHLVAGEEMLSEEDCLGQANFAIRMEYLTGTMEHLIERVTSFALKKRLMLDLALALQCLKHNNYIHRDIATKNTMFRGSLENPSGYLIDYGLSIASEKDSKGHLIPYQSMAQAGTPLYFAPEFFVPGLKNYSNKSDVWALGLTYLDMITGRERLLLRLMISHFKREDIDDIPTIQSDVFDPDKVQANLRLLITTSVPAEELDATINLLAKMLTLNPDDRVDVDGVLEDPFFTDLAFLASMDACDRLAPPLPAVGGKGSFTEGHHRVLKRMISSVLNEFQGNYDIFLLRAIDLYFLYVMKVPTEQSVLEDISMTCIGIAFKLYNNESGLPPKYGEAKIRDWEFKVVKSLGGVLKRPFLYEAARNIRTLLFLLDSYFINGSLEALNQYLLINPVTYTREIESKLGVTTFDKRQKLRILDKELRSKAFPAYLELILLLTESLQDESTEYMFRVIDLFLNYLRQSIETDPSKLKQIALAALLGGTTVRSAEAAPRAPGASEELKNQMLARVGEVRNPFFRAAQSMNELRHFYVDVLAQPTVFDDYFEMDPDLTMAIYRKPEVPQESTNQSIRVMMAKAPV